MLANDEPTVTTLDGTAVRFRRVRTNGIRLHVAEAGPPEGRPIVLLHGFPEFWYGWRHQIPALAARGFRVIAPDQRGYNLSDKPPAVRDYAIDRLADDVEGLVAELGCGADITLVGHDWGGIVAWWLAMRNPPWLERLVILNVPHPRVFRDHVQRSPRQMLRSWYILLFQLPGVPEWFLGRRRSRAAVESLRQSSRPGTFTPDELERYREAWSRSGAWRGMLNWYRAAFRAGAEPPGDGIVRVPTRILWGTRDRFLGREMLQPSAALCDHVEVFELPEASHWVQHEEPTEVTDRVIEFAQRGMRC
jgi:epoxide hydrolase 4